MPRWPNDMPVDEVERERVLALLREYATHFPNVSRNLGLQLRPADWVLDDVFADYLTGGLVIAVSDAREHFKRSWSALTGDLARSFVPLLARPVPPAAVVQLHLRGGARWAGIAPPALPLPEAAIRVDLPNADDGTPLKPIPFRFAHRADVWPLRLTSCQWEEGSRCLKVQIRSSFPLNELISRNGARLDRLRFYIAEDRPKDGWARRLRDALVRGRVEVQAGDNREKREARFCPAWNSADEWLLFPSERTFIGHSLLAEFFFFRFKPYFLDLCDLELVCKESSSQDLTVWVNTKIEKPEQLDRPSNEVLGRMLALNCVVTVNEFAKEMSLPLSPCIPLRLPEDKVYGPVLLDVQQVAILDGERSLCAPLFASTALDSEPDPERPKPLPRWYLDRSRPRNPQLLLTQLQVAGYSAAATVTTRLTWCYGKLPLAVAHRDDLNIPLDRRRWKTTRTDILVEFMGPLTPALWPTPDFPPPPLASLGGLLAVNGLALLNPQEAAQTLRTTLEALAGLRWNLAGQDPTGQEKLRKDEVKEWLGSDTLHEVRVTRAGRCRRVTIVIDDSKCPGGSVRPLEEALAAFFHFASPLNTATELILEDSPARSTPTSGRSDSP